MTNEQKQSNLNKLQSQYEKNVEEADSSLEIKMLNAEFNKNVELTESGVDVFASKPDNSPYQCEGCGS
jgi:phosphotransferase system HPr-like phosphotransfer protein